MQHLLFSLASAIVGINFLLASGSVDTETPSFEHYDLESVVALDATPMPYKDIIYERRTDQVGFVTSLDETKEIEVKVNEESSILSSPTIATTTVTPSVTVTVTQTPSPTPTCQEGTCEPSITSTPTATITQTPTPSPSGTSLPTIPVFENQPVPSPTPLGSGCAFPTPGNSRPPNPENPAVCF